MSEQQPRGVIVTDIHMQFWSMVGFMVKWSIASIPALFILVIIGFAFSALLMGPLHNFVPGANAP